MRRSLLSLLVVTSVTVASVQAQQAAKQTPADEVIAITKAQWAAEMKDPTNVKEQMKDVAADYTEFNGQFATRLDGKELSMRLGEATGLGSGKTVAGEMANPKVQLYAGDVAVLTYNYVGLSKDKDGEVNPVRAKSTRVYVKQGGKWTLVHANFGADPPPQQ